MSEGGWDDDDDLLDAMLDDDGDADTDAGMGGDSNANDAGGTTVIGGGGGGDNNTSVADEAVAASPAAATAASVAEDAMPAANPFLRESSAPEGGGGGRLDDEENMSDDNISNVEVGSGWGDDDDLDLGGLSDESDHAEPNAYADADAAETDDDEKDESQVVSQTQNARKEKEQHPPPPPPPSALSNLKQPAVPAPIPPPPPPLDDTSSPSSPYDHDEEADVPTKANANGENSNLDTTMENTLAMLAEHEAMMEEELETIVRNDVNDSQDVSTQKLSAPAIAIGDDNADAKEEEEEEWDFEDDADIFNEENEELNVDNDGVANVDTETVTLAQPISWEEPAPSMSPIPPALSSGEEQLLDANPFLNNDVDVAENENDESHKETVSMIPALSETTTNNNNELTEKITVEEELEEEEDWDFEDDDDIFNEGNDELPISDGGEEGVLECQAPMKPPSPPPPPPPPAINPFLPSTDDGKEENRGLNASMVPAAKNNVGFSNAARSSKDVVALEQAAGNDDVLDEGDDGDGDGWSDEDFFEGDDVGSPPSITPPGSPSPLIQQAIASQQQHSGIRHPFGIQQPLRSVPSSVPPPLNPNQRRIHQMLSTYIASLSSPDFLTRLHQKLHYYQQNPGGNNNNNNSAGNNSAHSSAAADLKAYYTTRPGLRKYTLGVELDRMDYRLILENGKSTEDKDVIRSYFGVGEGGERLHDGGNEEDEVVTTEDLLIRSANQSLLADMLVALTGSEEDVATNGSSSEDDFFNHNGGHSPNNAQSTMPGLILSGPTLCMTSVAESCNFTVDLQCGKVEAVCLLAISVPFHGQSGSDNDEVAKDGRLILARAKVSVRFRPGGEGGDANDEPTVQYAVQGVTPLQKPDSPLIRQAAISLAHDAADPFFHDEYANDESATDDARDQFLLSHHLLNDSGVIAVSDHLVKLRGAAEASSTGFRSALRQLDGVTNVSAKLQFLKEASGQGNGAGVGLGGFGLALPSAEEIDAAQREAMAGQVPPPPPNSDFRFPRPENFANDGPTIVRNAQPRPPPPPPPMHLQAETDAPSRPRPLIGGLFMSGLSRLAAAATQPDEAQKNQSSWGGGGTGLTPPSSPRDGGSAQMQMNQQPTLYRREEWNEEQRGYTGLTPKAVKQPQQQQITEDHFEEVTPTADLSPMPPSARVAEHHGEVAEQDDGLSEGDDGDAGWSDDEFDFEDAAEDQDANQEEEGEEVYIEEKGKIENQSFVNAPPVFNRPMVPAIKDEPKEETSSISKPATVHPASQMTSVAPTRPPPPPPPPLPRSQPHTANQQQHFIKHQQRTFEEEFVIVLKEKIDIECAEMQQTGRMKRWTPLREDAVMRKRLMEVMVNQIHS